MAIRPVLQLGDPRLRQPSAAVAQELLGTARLACLIEDLRDTMASRDGAGLAAPQIAVPLRVVIFGITRNPRYPDAPPIPETVLINPEWTPVGTETVEGWEGCLSVPGMRAPVWRSARVHMIALTPCGQRIDREVEGFEARIVQHECDHLNGVLLPDRLASA
ncbi:MAG: peptide deformylase [Cyanobacteria bacterium]|nr:peptide deformylase [Cyanobacteriota bacterium]